ncbi:hypothetical protein CPB85DRAFT_1267677 [Mucidula mucida]|nr:hypothetical protein CPB85DRAFT_1267677 [Mucidula mucida]
MDEPDESRPPRAWFVALGSPIFVAALQQSSARTLIQRELDEEILTPSDYSKLVEYYDRRPSIMTASILSFVLPVTLIFVAKRAKMLRSPITLLGLVGSSTSPLLYHGVSEFGKSVDLYHALENRDGVITAAANAERRYRHVPDRSESASEFDQPRSDTPSPRQSNKLTATPQSSRWEQIRASHSQSAQSSSWDSIRQRHEAARVNPGAPRSSGEDWSPE